MQARSQGGFKGVRMNPPCSLAKFIFNTAAVQGTIIQSCSGIVTDGIQAIMQLLQGVVICDRDQKFRSVKIVLDRLIILRKRCNYDVIIDHTSHE